MDNPEIVVAPTNRANDLDWVSGTRVDVTASLGEGGTILGVFFGRGETCRWFAGAEELPATLFCGNFVGQILREKLK